MKRYEQSIRVMTTFFAALLTLGLKKILDGPPLVFGIDTWPCFFLSVFIFLRFLLGSSNHMWVEFVNVDRDSPALPTTGVPHPARIISDFVFLLALGLIGFAMCSAADLRTFFNLNIALLGMALCWSVFYRLIAYGKTPFSTKPLEEKTTWNFWLYINALQLLAVLSIKFSAFGNSFGRVPPWLWPDQYLGVPWRTPMVILVAVYFALFILDVYEQMKVLKSAK